MLHGDTADIAAEYEQRDRELALARMRSAPQEEPDEDEHGILLSRLHGGTHRFIFGHRWYHLLSRLHGGTLFGCNPALTTALLSRLHGGTLSQRADVLQKRLLSRLHGGTR